MFKELPHSLEVVSFPKGDEPPPTSRTDVTKVQQSPTPRPNRVLHTCSSTSMRRGVRLVILSYHVRI